MALLDQLLPRSLDLLIRNFYSSRHRLNSLFASSAALSSKATQKWTDATLDKWIKSPADFAPGNSMAFAGVASGKDRSDLIAYLKGG